MDSALEIKSFRGKDIAQFIDDIGRIRLKVFLIT